MELKNFRGQFIDWNSVPDLENEEEYKNVKCEVTGGGKFNTATGNSTVTCTYNITGESFTCNGICN